MPVLLLIGLESCLLTHRNTELARDVGVLIARAKRIFILIDEFFLLSRHFLKEPGNMFFFASNELKKHAWKFGRTRKSGGNTRLSAHVSTAFLVMK